MPQRIHTVAPSNVSLEKFCQFYQRKYQTFAALRFILCWLEKEWMFLIISTLFQFLFEFIFIKKRKFNLLRQKKITKNEILFRPGARHWHQSSSQILIQLQSSTISLCWKYNEVFIKTVSDTNRFNFKTEFRYSLLFEPTVCNYGLIFFCKLERCHKIIKFF